MLFVERILVALILVVVISQIIYPMIADQPYFWIFRRSSRRLARAREKKAEAEEAREIWAIESEAERIRPPREESEDAVDTKKGTGSRGDTRNE